MDVVSWKRILLHWVNQCGFLERNFYNIEQSDIEVFFTRFREHIRSESDAGKIASDLVQFLKNEYPEFEVLLDDENALSSADYIYVYSLLLHFSCVKSPEEFFHKICQAMHEQFQEGIAIFFKALLEKDSITKSSLRHAIAAISPLHLQLPQRQISSESPLRTPRMNKISPQTPKSFMIDERNRELHLVKAQLDTERYEKGFLEVQLKQNEDKIAKLSQDQKKHIAEIHELRNQLLTKDTENFSPNKSAQDEQVKKRLRKEITQKEELTLKLREELNSLKEENELLKEKFSYSKQNVLQCLRQVQELEIRLDDLKTELEQKNHTIQYLTDTKLELEHFINESRSSPGSRPDLNTSAECLDLSMSRTTNSSGSVSSPENLGCSVIDIQLREKERENTMLRQEMNSMQVDNSKVSKRVCELLVRYADTFDICNENLLANEENGLMETFMVFENYVDKLVSNYTLSTQCVKLLKDETNKLSSLNVNLEQRVTELEQMLSECKLQISELEKGNEALMKGKESLEEMFKEQGHVVKTLETERDEVAGRLSALQAELDKFREERSQTEKDFVIQIENLSVELKDKTQCIEKFDLNTKELKCQIESLRMNIEEMNCHTDDLKNSLSGMEKFKSALEEERNSLKSKVEDLQSKLSESEKTEESLTKQMQDYENLKENFTQSQAQLLELEANLQSKEGEVKSLAADVSSIKKDNETLEAKFANLSSNYQKEQQSFAEEVVKLQKIISEKDTFGAEKVRAVQQLENEKSELNTKLKTLQNAMKEKTEIQQAELAKLTIEMENVNQLLKIRKSELSSLQIEFKELQSVRDEQIQQLENEKAELNKKIDLLEVQIEENNMNHDRITSKLQAEFDNLQSEKDSFIQQLKNEKSQAEESIQKLEEDKSKLSSEVEALQSKIEEKLQCVQHLEAEKSRLNAKNDEREKCIQGFEEIKLELNNKIAELQAQLEENKECHSMLESELQSEVDELRAEKDQLEAERDQLNVKISELQAEVKEVEQKRRAELESLRADNQDALKCAESEIVALNENLSSLRVELKEKLAELESLHSDKENSILNSAELKKNLLSLQEQLEVKQKSFKEAISQSESEIVRLTAELSEKDTAIQHLEEKKAALASELEEQQKQSSESVSESKLLIAGLEKSKEEKDCHIQQLESQLSELQRSVQDSAEFCTKVRSENETLLESIAEKEREIVEFETTVKQMTSEQTKLQGEIEKLSGVAAERVKEIRDFEGSLRHVLEKLGEDIESGAEGDYISRLVSKVTAVVDELQNLKEANSEKSERIVQLLLENSESQTELKEATEESKKREVELIAVEDKLRISESNLMKEKEQVEVQKSEKVKLEADVSELRESLNEVSNKLSEAQESIKKLETENKNLVKDLDSARVQFQESKENLEKLASEKSALAQDIKDHETEIAKVVDERNVLHQKIADDEVKQQKLVELETDISELQTKAQNLEVQLAQADNDLCCEKLKVHNLQGEKTKLAEENQKLLEISQNATKRLERQALKLGESQARTSKLEKECEQLKKTAETSQKETAKLQAENRSLKAELTESKKCLEQQIARSKTLEDATYTLTATIETQSSEISQLQTDNKAHEAKIKKLATVLSEANLALEKEKRENESLEKKTVELTLEIGGLNKTIEEQRSTKSADLQEVTEMLIKMKNANFSLQEINEKLQTELNEAHEETSRLSDQLSKLSLRLEILQTERDTISNEVSELKASVNEIRAEKENLEQENSKSLIALKELEMRQNEILNQRQFSETQLLDKLQQTEDLLAEKVAEIVQLKSEIEQLKSAQTLKERATQDDLLLKLQASETALAHEKQLNEKLKEDSNILRAKLYKHRGESAEKEKLWEEERKRLEATSSTAEERIKENRLELEGKLEKMKAKMKTLYTEEVTKIKSKHEREIDELRQKSHKYEEHIQKLSKEIFRLNEEIQELRRANTFMETKLKDLESFGTTSFKRPQSMNVPISSNLRMEDEEGEMFNNTYLADLKSGRMSDFGRSSVSVLELQHRNSLAAPHLKSAYAAQYQDHNLGEDDIKDGMPISLDDSLSSLLNTGQRKKAVGATSYKRPGPPTPSKNAGRLSFGGLAELPREVLKDANDSNVVSSTKRTPAKFKLFSSRFSMKDETDVESSPGRPKCRLPTRLLGAQFTSSTPRKSKAHFDQRRQLEKIMTFNSSQSDSEFGAVWQDKWRAPKDIYTTESATSDANTPQFSGCEAYPFPEPKPIRDRRVSVYQKGNIYSRSRLPSKILRDQVKSRAKQQRTANFNSRRKSINTQEIRLRKSLLNRQNAVDGSRRASDRFCDFPQEFVFDGQENGSTEFEKLLREKESRAPFEITEIKFISTSSAGSNNTINSRTLYGGSFLFNRKIPSISTTKVRKSSIYVRKDGRVYVLNKSQTLTLMDLIGMWRQMNSTIKAAIGFCLLIVILVMAYFV